MRTPLAAAAAALVLAGAGAQDPERAVIRSGVPWLDTDGRRVYAGGANVWRDEASTPNVFYMVGEGNKTQDDCSECLNLYSSLDLATWRFESCLVRNEDVRAAAPPPFNNASYAFYRMERPKLFQCPGSGRFVLWFHCDTADFAMTSVGVLTADAPTGPFAWASQCFKPDGADSYDMGVFVDDARQPGGDGRAYLVRSVFNNFAGISQLTEDCLNTTGIVSAGPKMEAQAIMRDSAGVLHMVGSHESGWGPNAALFITSPNASLVGAVWGPDYNPSGSGDTFDSQSSFLFPFRHADGHVTHVWMADRWDYWGPGSLRNMTQVWLPLEPPRGPPPTNVSAGAVLALLLCDASDATQLLALNTTLVHVGSGLCLTQPPGANTSTALTFEACTGGAAQAWFGAGPTVANASAGFGAACVNLNCGNGFGLGAEVIVYRCGNQTQWNSRFDFPLEVGAPGLFAALSDAAPTGYCLAASPADNPALWRLPWLPAWSLRDF